MCGVNGTVGKAFLVQFCQEIKDVYNKWEKLISLPFSTKFGPFFNVDIVLFFWCPLSRRPRAGWQLIVNSL